nr:HNH endonuclease [Leisingera sp. ANG-M7]
MAHIFAANDGGPRSNGELSEEDRASYSNLILLCANCHTLIDKEPETYTNDLVTAWKREHIERLSGLFGLQVFKTRQELRGAIDPLLRENRAIHQAFGPDAEYQFNPEAPEAISWKSKVRVSLIPNSNRILLLLDANSALLDEDEKAIVEQFRMHINGLISRHLDGGGEINIRFPQKMNTIACEEGA